MRMSKIHAYLVKQKFDKIQNPFYLFGKDFAAFGPSTPALLHKGGGSFGHHGTLILTREEGAWTLPKPLFSQGQRELGLCQIFISHSPEMKHPGSPLTVIDNSGALW